MRRLVITSGYVLLFMLLFVLLAACGGDEQKTPTLTPTVTLTVPPTSTATAAPTPTLTPTSTPLPVGFSNRSWTPVIQAFDGVEMVLVPAGCFLMGSEDGDEDEQPVHEVCLDAFWIDRTEVTNAQSAAFHGLGVLAGNWTDDDRPRVWVRWVDADTLCARRGARLPTEAEWEYAARGPEGWAYPWGNEFAAEHVVYGSQPGGYTPGVGSQPGGASWVGALDLSGNVWEWVADRYGPYPSARQVNPTGPASGRSRVVRGGAWVNSDPDSLRATYRGRFLFRSTFFFIGFRCARAASDSF